MIHAFFLNVLILISRVPFAKYEQMDHRCRFTPHLSFTFSEFSVDFFLWSHCGKAKILVQKTKKKIDLIFDNSRCLTPYDRCQYVKTYGCQKPVSVKHLLVSKTLIRSVSQVANVQEP